MFQFSDSLKVIKAKLGKEIHFEESERHCHSLEKKSKFLYIEKYELSIIFHDSKKSIAFMEIEKGKFIFRSISSINKTPEKAIEELNALVNELK